MLLFIFPILTGYAQEISEENTQKAYQNFQEIYTDLEQKCEGCSTEEVEEIFLGYMYKNVLHMDDPEFVLNGFEKTVGNLGNPFDIWNVLTKAVNLAKVDLPEIDINKLKEEKIPKADWEKYEISASIPDMGVFGEKNDPFFLGEKNDPLGNFLPSNLKTELSKFKDVFVGIYNNEDLSQSNGEDILKLIGELNEFENTKDCGEDALYEKNDQSGVYFIKQVGDWSSEKEYYEYEKIYEGRILKIALLRQEEEWRIAKFISNELYDPNRKKSDYSFHLFDYTILNKDEKTFQELLDNQIRNELPIHQAVLGVQRVKVSSIEKKEKVTENEEDPEEKKKKEKIKKEIFGSFFGKGVFDIAFQMLAKKALIQIKDDKEKKDFVLDLFNQRFSLLAKSPNGGYTKFYGALKDKGMGVSHIAVRKDDKGMYRLTLGFRNLSEVYAKAEIYFDDPEDLKKVTISGSYDFGNKLLDKENGPEKKLQSGLSYRTQKWGMSGYIIYKPQTSSISSTLGASKYFDKGHKDLSVSIKYNQSQPNDLDIARSLEVGSSFGFITKKNDIPIDVGVKYTYILENPTTTSGHLIGTGISFGF
ncbi:MAG: hypothetical protein H6620_10935 [Halobacteriovoraceae bacterium]|nr:hypothetical protein [Halobacteriovoraceae bacterium]